MACLIRPPKRTSITKAAPRRSTTVPVMPWNRWWGHLFWTLESMTIVTCSPTLNDCSDLVIGESPRWRGLRRNFCRVFSMIPFEALTISSPAVVDVEHVELEHLARRAESFREGRPRPAPVPVNPLLDVGPRFRGHPNFRPVSVDADDLSRQQPSSPCGIRAPVNDPPRRALGDRLADQNRERRFKLCFVHGRGHPQEDAVGLRGAVLLQRDDTGPGRGDQLIDLDDPGRVDAPHGRLQIDPTLARLLDLDDERPPAAEHPRVHILAAHPVHRMGGTARFPHDLGRDHFLDARRVHLARAPATVTTFPPAAPARPTGLRDAAGQLAVAASEVERIHLEVDMVEPGVEDRNDIRAVQGRFLVNEIRDPLSDLAVHLGLQRLRARQSELGPQRFLSRGHLEIDLRSDPERLELPGLELSGREGRKVVVPTREATADPARSLAIHGNLPNRAAPLLVRQAVAESAEEAAKACITEGPISERAPFDQPGRGEDLVHGSRREGGLKGSREQDDADQQVREDDSRHQDVRAVSLFQEREQAQEDTGHGGKDQHQHAEVQIACGGEANEFGPEETRRDRLVLERMARDPRQDEPEEEERDRHDDPAPQDVVNQSIDVLDLGQHGAAQRSDAMLDEAQARSSRDHRTPPNSPSARAAIAMPSPARKTAKRNRTFAAFDRTSSRVPRFVPVNAPTITIAASCGLTRPWE